MTALSPWDDMTIYNPQGVVVVKTVVAVKDTAAIVKDMFCCISI